MSDVPEPDGYSEKEVYAFFGLAAYCAQVLEKGLVNMVVAFKTFGLPITRGQFDTIFGDHDSRTLGELIKMARSHKIPIPPETNQLLRRALQKRNYLNHDFFAEHAGHFITDGGRQTMIGRLSALILLFQQATDACEPVYVPLLKQMGVTDESVQRQAEAMVARSQYDQDA